MYDVTMCVSMVTACLVGQLSMKDGEVSEEIPASLEVGLLAVVRKLITLLPDQRVRQVIGHVLQHEALIAIAHNKSIVVRTAVVRVSTENKAKIVRAGQYIPSFSWSFPNLHP